MNNTALEQRGLEKISRAIFFPSCERSSENA
jgi:hypothetical protein